jgi:hypothetical protein
VGALNDVVATKEEEGSGGVRNVSVKRHRVVFGRERTPSVGDGRWKF